MPLIRGLEGCTPIVKDFNWLVLCVAVFMFGNGWGNSTAESAHDKGRVKAVSKYDYRFGEDKPFLPSMATTEDGKFIRLVIFPTATYCRHCHEASYHQWRESLHANSFREPFYLANVRLLYREESVAASRHCEGCHNPIALLSGNVTSHPVAPNGKFNQDGVTCSVCHSIQRLQPTYGLGAYVMGTPAVIVDASGKPIPGEVPYREIMAHTDRHVRAVMKDFYKTPEFCSACHKANLPESLNHYKWLRAINLYDEWQASSYSHRSPLPFYSKELSTCQTCHMGRETMIGADLGSKDGMLASHRWIGGNTAVPFYYKYDEQLQRTIDSLKDKKLNVDLFALRRNNEEDYIAPIGSTRFSIARSDKLEAVVVIQNKGTGHTLIPEQRDMFEAWTAFEVRDADGRLLCQSGQIEPDGSIDPLAHSFTNRMLDEKGNLLVRHEIWLQHTQATNTTIAPGRSTIVRYAFTLPADVKGPISITAKVNYRHFNKPFTDFALGSKHPAYPVVEMTSRTRIVYIGGNEPEKPDPADNPDWMRWNNFGVALIDQRQYGKAADAFQHVAKLRPEYATGIANLGVAYYQGERYSEAEQALSKSLSMAPGDLRTLYYLALVDRSLGSLKDAAEKLEKVALNYPLSLDTHRELGFTYYKLHQDDLAKAQFLAAQQIDPDDLGAHYYLEIIYRRLQENEKADVEAKCLADERGDPAAHITAMQFLNGHPEVSGESMPWHVHQLTGLSSPLNSASGGAP